MREQGGGPSVEELARAARAGDGRVWGELIERYDGMVHAVVSSFRFREVDVDDIVQTVWLRAMEQIGALREPERFGGWLKRIAFRECLTLRTRARREYLDDKVAEHVVEPAPGPEARTLQAEMQRAVRAAVATLTPRNRDVVDVLFYRPPMDYALVARTAGMPQGSIGPTRARALKAVRRHLEHNGFVEPAAAGAA